MAGKPVYKEGIRHGSGIGSCGWMLVSEQAPLFRLKVVGYTKQQKVLDRSVSIMRHSFILFFRRVA
jgi:hypothetical protein